MYEGSPANQYIILNIYCSHTQDFEFDYEFVQHEDYKQRTYYQMFINSKSGCSALSVDNYWFFMKQLKFPFAILGAIGGLITCFFGRLLLKYVSFVMTIVGTIVLSNTVVFLIEN